MGTAAARARVLAAGITAAVLGTVALPARAGVIDDALPVDLPVEVPELPVLHEAAVRGEGVAAPLPRKAPTSKTVDGLTADWRGTATGFGGTMTISRGELVYTDHLFDAYGADDGQDAER